MPLCESLFLDRDGTVIVDKHYLGDPAGVELLPGVGEALAGLAAKGVKFYLVSNQSGIGRGIHRREDADACNSRLFELLRPYGVAFTDSLYCPHEPEADCNCRKPRTGMWEELKARHGLDASTCIMAGDKKADLGFAARSGFMAGVLVLTGKGRDTAEKAGVFQENGAYRKSGGVRIAVSSPAEGLPHAVVEDFCSLAAALELLGVSYPL